MFYDFITQTTDIFVEKMREAFALTLFQQNKTGIFEILTFEILTSRQLTTSLVLNNRALVSERALLLLCCRSALEDRAYCDVSIVFCVCLYACCLL